MNDFYRAYYLGLLQDVFSVLTDTLHKPGFKLQACLLSGVLLLHRTLRTLSAHQERVWLEWSSRSTRNSLPFPDPSPRTHSSVSTICMTFLPPFLHI